MLSLRKTLAPVLLAGALAAPLGAQTESGRPNIAAVDTSSNAALRAPGGMTTRVYNNVRFDEALRPYGRKYVQLSMRERRQVQDAFENLLPGERLEQYRLNATQARAVVYIAFGAPAPAYGDDRGRRTEDIGRLSERVSGDARWIRDAITPLRRSARHTMSHDQELAVLHDVTDRARLLVSMTARMSCQDAYDRAQGLLTAARDAEDRMRESVVQAWMAVGDERLARMQRLSDDVDDNAMRCVVRR